MEKERKQFLVKSFDITHPDVTQKMENWINETADYSPEITAQGGRFIFVIMRAVHRMPNPRPEPKPTPAPAPKKKTAKKKK